MSESESIKAKVSGLMKSSLKGGDKVTLAHARNLHAAIRKKEIDSKEDLDDAGVLKIISSLAKQRQDSIEQFKKGGRDDLVEAEEKELSFLQQFLPPQMSEDELSRLVDQAISESGASSSKDMGQVMKVLLPKVQGQADGKRISQLVREKLSG